MIVQMQFGQRDQRGAGLIIQVAAWGHPGLSVQERICVWWGVSLEATSSDSPCDCVQWGWEGLAISAQRGRWLDAPAEGAQVGADLRGSLDCPCPASLLSLTGTPSPGNPGLSLCFPSTLGPQQRWKAGRGVGRAELHRSDSAYRGTTRDPISLWEPQFPHLNMELTISPSWGCYTDSMIE